jgi:carbonic anhydrase
MLMTYSVPQSVRDDVAYLRGHELIRKETKVTGFVYETDTGKLVRVE